jgi:hypothetical protein
VIAIFNLLKRERVAAGDETSSFPLASRNFSYQKYCQTFAKKALTT